MNSLKVNFVDFYKELNKERNVFINILREILEVEISSDPDLLFYGNYGTDHLKYDCFKVFYSSENVRPDYRFCDFSISFDYSESQRNFRLPLYVIHLDEYLNNSQILALKEAPKNKFCNFVYSNERALNRIEFFKILSNYRLIDSPGKVMNNMNTDLVGKRYDYLSKLKYISNYKFTIAFENESFEGYTTEKIIHPLLVGSIPIYWGNPLIDREFDDSLIINVHDYSSFEGVIDRIIEIDSDDERFESMTKGLDFLEQKNRQILNELKLFFQTILVEIESKKPLSSRFFGRINRFHSRSSILFKNIIIKIKLALK